MLNKRKLSIWLALIAWGLAAFMAHPNLASLVALSGLAVVLVLLRWVARAEGVEGARP